MATLFGAGLRPPHYQSLLASRSSVIEWFEIITENFANTQGRPRWILEQIRRDYPVAFHGVSLSIGSEGPFDGDYLQKLKQLIEDFDPFLVSDHFCWTGLPHNNSHNLLPLALNKKTLDTVVPRIQQAQDFLGRPLIFENASAYTQMTDDQLSEWEFVHEVCKQTGCGILLDLNNLYVTSCNLGLNPFEEFNKIPLAFVRQIHLAGYSERTGYLFDTHSREVQPPVWDLYRHWLSQGIHVPTMMEWDDQIPPLWTLEQEIIKMRHLHKEVTTPLIKSESTAGGGPLEPL